MIKNKPVDITAITGMSIYSLSNEITVTNCINNLLKILQGIQNNAVDEEMKLI